MAEMNSLEEQKATCCGGPAPNEADACCVKDAEAKDAGRSGCGCGTADLQDGSAPAGSRCCA
jgi:hypothetical protein